MASEVQVYRYGAVFVIPDKLTPLIVTCPHCAEVLHVLNTQEQIDAMKKLHSRE